MARGIGGLFLHLNPTHSILIPNFTNHPQITGACSRRFVYRRRIVASLASRPSVRRSRAEGAAGALVRQGTPASIRLGRPPVNRRRARRRARRL